MKKLTFALMIAVVCSFVSGCGYTTASALPVRLRTVYVEPFKNSIDFTKERQRNIYFPLLEVDVRNAVINRYLFDGNLRIAEELEADLILQGELIDYRRQALRYTDDDDVQEYRIQIVVNIKLIDTDYDEILWEETSFVGEATYFVSGPQVSTESAALEEAKTDLARRIVERTIENW